MTLYKPASGETGGPGTIHRPGQIRFPSIGPNPGIGPLGGSTIPAPPSFFVAAAGSDSNSGTQAQPWQTLTKVNAQTFAPNTTVNFNGGDTFSGTLTVPTSGATGQPITFTSYGTGQATISAATNTDGINGTELSYVTVQNLTVTGAAGTSGRGIFFANATLNSANITISNCNVSGFAGDGIIIAATSTTTTITNHQILNCTVNNCTTGLSSTTAGIRISGTYGAQVRGTYQVFSSVISGCLSKNNTGVAGTPNWCGSGIYMAQAQGGLITNCVADTNGANCNSGAGGPGGIWFADCDTTVIQFCESKNTKTANIDGNGFDIDGGCTNCILEYNYSHDNQGSGLLCFMYSDPTHISNNNGNVIRFNVSARDAFSGARLTSSTSTEANNGQFYNNIIYGQAGANFEIVKNTGNLGWKIANNIFITNSASTLNIVHTSGSSGNPSGVTLAGNCYYAQGAGGFQIVWNGTTYSTYATWQTATGQEKIAGVNVGFNTDPALLGTAPSAVSTNMDLMRLNASSPLFNNGVDLFANFSINPGPRDYFGNTITTSGPWSPGIGGNRAAKQMVILSTAGAANWTAAADCVSIWKVMAIGAGGGNNALSTGAGGGSYAESLLSAIPIVPSVTLVPYVVGAGGNTINGGDTVFGATSLANAVALGPTLAVAAQGGRTNSSTTGGIGGLAANSVGTLKYNGGNGGNNPGSFNGGGGGAAGLYGLGGNGGNGGAGSTASGGGGGANGGTAGTTPTTTTGGVGGKNTYLSGQGTTSITNGGAGTSGAGGSGAGGSGGTGGAGGPGVEFRLSGTAYGAGGGGGSDGGTGTSTNGGGNFGGGGGGRATAALGGTGFIAILYDTTATLA